MHFIANLTGRVLFNNNANIVQLNGGAVIFMAGHGDFELARQIGKFGVEG